MSEEAAKEAKPYPFDYLNLEKGHTITAEEVERKTKTKRGTAAYAWAAIRYQREIELAMANLGKPVSTKQSNFDIEIMTDPQATRYMGVRADVHERGLYKVLRGLAIVDIRNLSTDELENHQNRVIYISRMTQAMRLGKEEGMQIIKHKRSTPLPPTDKKEGNKKDDTERKAD